jgi:CheY-like chemotaxis protein
MREEEAMSVSAKPTAKIILVVEDDEDTQSVFLEALSLLTPYTVHITKNGSEALYFVTHTRPSLLLIDYRLPGDVNGITLYDQLHALPELESIPAIIISAHISEKLTHESESRKLIRLEKPFDLDVFLDTVKQAFDEPESDKQQPS